MRKKSFVTLPSFQASRRNLSPLARRAAGGGGGYEIPEQGVRFQGVAAEFGMELAAEQLGVGFASRYQKDFFSAFHPRPSSCHM